MKPPISYFGGKIRLGPWIASLLPPHRVYLEPFFGSGSVLFAKEPSPHEIVNDLDGNVVNFFKVLRERPLELEEVCALTPYARDEFLSADMGVAGLDAVERARRFFVRSSQGFNQVASMESRSTWATSSKRGSSMPSTVRNKIHRFGAAAERLRNVSFDNCDAVAFLERYASPEAAGYLDPPYHPSTRGRSADGRVPNDYAHEMTDEDHRRLLTAVLELPGAWVVSGYACDLYDELLADWHRVERRIHAAARNHGRETAKHATEIIWSNRPLPVPPPQPLSFDLTYEAAS